MVSKSESKTKDIGLNVESIQNMRKIVSVDEKMLFKVSG
jgi:hypothetical protein